VCPLLIEAAVVVPCEEEKAYARKILGPYLDPMKFPEADELAAAVAQALSEPNPKRRYLAIPRAKEGIAACLSG
jgi:hypothetical protein